MVQTLHCSSPVKTVKFAEAEGNLILLQRVSNSQPITNHYLRISAHDWPYVLSMVPLTYSSWKKEWSMISTGYCCWSRRELYGCSASELCSNWNKSNQIAGLLKPRSFLSGKSKLLLVAWRASAAAPIITSLCDQELQHSEMMNLLKWLKTYFPPLWNIFLSFVSDILHVIKTFQHLFCHKTRFPRSRMTVITISRKI